MRSSDFSASKIAGIAVPTGFKVISTLHKKWTGRRSCCGPSGVGLDWTAEARLIPEAKPECKVDGVFQQKHGIEFSTSPLSTVMQWICGVRLTQTNLRKIRAHRIKAEEVEKALSNDSIPIYEQYVEG